MKQTKKKNTRQVLNNLEHQKHVILTCTDMTGARVQGKFHLTGEIVTD